MLSTAELLERCAALERAIQEIEGSVQPDKDCLVCILNDDVPCGRCTERARISGMVKAIRMRVLA